MKRNNPAVVKVKKMSSSTNNSSPEKHKEEDLFPFVPSAYHSRSRVQQRECLTSESDEEEDLHEYINSRRQQQRRATDFSQADHDLRRFLALREQKKRDSDQDLLRNKSVFSIFF